MPGSSSTTRMRISGAWRGSVRTTVVPPPGVSSKARVPPWAATIDGTIARPSPDPFIEESRAIR